jgi:RNA polymerase sigma factor (sigma-70 family)
MFEEPADKKDEGATPAEGENRHADRNADAAFETSRARLLSIAYRMLGSRAEAEDIVQETYLKWHAQDASTLKTPAAWLTTVATRLSIDRLRHLKLERDRRPGADLPSGGFALDPSLDDFAPSAETLALRSSELSYGLGLLLDRLSPEERAALVLHEAFDCGYSEIGLVLSKTAQACRQIVHRAKVRLSQEQGQSTKQGLKRGRGPKLGQHLRCGDAERYDDEHHNSELQDGGSHDSGLHGDRRRNNKRPNTERNAGERRNEAASPDLLTRLRDAIASQDKAAVIELMIEDAHIETTPAARPDGPERIVASQTVSVLSETALKPALSGAALAALLVRAASRGIVAEAIVLHGCHALALLDGCEIVAILYVEARGDWIARCRFTTRPDLLRTANRLFDPRRVLAGIGRQAVTC